MKTKTDVYKTIIKPTENILYKEKNSKFYGFAYHITSKLEAKKILNNIQKEYHSANHYCYAYQIGTEKIIFRANDDGEPNNSAGASIYGQIQSYKVTNIIIIVVRYFGGTKLGVGGLKKAYKTSAKHTLEACNIIEKTIKVSFTISFGYKDINKVMRIIKEKQLTIINQNLEINCTLLLLVRKTNAENIFTIFNNIPDVKIKKKQLKQ